MLADAIVEVTETGSSLKANHLKIIDTSWKAKRISSPQEDSRRSLEARET